MLREGIQFFFKASLKGTDHLEDLGLGGKYY